MIKFFVPGRPRTKGSAKWIPNRHTGVPFQEKNKNLESWTAHVMIQATMAMTGRSKFQGPVKVSCMFFFSRPKSHYGTGRNAHILKASAPQYPTGRNCGDNDKLERAVFDALTGLAYDDDSQIVENTSKKAYCKSDEGVWVYVEEVTE